MGCSSSCVQGNAADLEVQQSSTAGVHKSLSSVQVHEDSELVEVLERLRSASDLYGRGHRTEAAARLGEAKELLGRLEESVEIQKPSRSESLRDLRTALESDPTLQAIKVHSEQRRGSGPAESNEAEVEVELEAPAAGEGPDAKGLKAGLEALLSLCRECRVFDAAKALEQLEVDLRLARARCNGGGEQELDELSGVVEEVESKLRQEDAVIAALRAVHGRMRQTLSSMGPRALPMGEKDNRWAQVTIKDPVIGSEFLADIRMRFLEVAERDREGPSTQICICGQLSRFPLCLEQFISVYRETDLYQKDWIADCERCEGEVAGPERFYSALSRIINSSQLLPCRLDVLTVREFATCDTAPLSGRRSGVLVMDMSPPSDSREFASWQMPPHLEKKSVRLSGVGLILYFMPSEGRPEWCDVFAFARCAAPLPQWIVPLSLIKRFLAGHFISVFKAIRVHIADRWAELRYQERIAGCQDFYGPIAALRSSRAGKKQVAEDEP